MKLANAGDNIAIAGAAAISNTVGGVNAGQGNLIDGSPYSGISLDATGASINAVVGNTIGLNALGTAALGNQNGIYIETQNNTIGGTTGGARNIISGNVNGIWFNNTAATGNIVEGNFIGTNPAGTAAIGNKFGIFSGAGQSNTIGGDATSAPATSSRATARPGSR